MPADGGAGGGGAATTVVIPDSMEIKKSKESFIQETAARIFANIDFKSVGKSVQECAEESKKKAETLAEVLGI